MLHMEQQVLEMIATGAPEASVLDALCRVIDQESGLMSANANLGSADPINGRLCARGCRS